MLTNNNARRGVARMAPNNAVKRMLRGVGKRQWPFLSSSPHRGKTLRLPVTNVVASQ